MKNKNASLIIILSLCFSVYALAYLVPTKMTPLTNQYADNLQKTNPLNSQINSDTIVSPELLQYLQANQKPISSKSDRIDSEELIDNFEDLQQNYGLKSSPNFKNPTQQANEDNLLGMSYDESAFSIPQGLEDVVNFWTHIFGVYDKNYTIFYNPDNVGIVYSVLDFSDLKSENDQDEDAIKNQMVKEETNRLSSLLKNLGKKMKGSSFDFKHFSKEELRLANLFGQDKTIDLDEIGNKENIGVRVGFAHRFKQAILLSGQYMPAMEKIFTDHGLPTELTCIPFVESSFSTTAFSSANAAGIWQFIEDTGKMYLSIDSFVDERYDPIRATNAAASHLSHEYKMLKSWPLTINAYNTGPGRMLDAMETLKTKDINTIVKNYKGSGYGFDSRNYFPEVLAAIEVYKNQAHYFGTIKTLPVEPYDYIQMPVDVNLKDLFDLSGVDTEVMKEINLAIRPEVLEGKKSLPKGYYLKTLPQDKDSIIVAAQELQQEYQYSLKNGVPADKQDVDVSMKPESEEQ